MRRGHEVDELILQRTNQEGSFLNCFKSFTNAYQARLKKTKEK